MSLTSDILTDGCIGCLGDDVLMLRTSLCLGMKFFVMEGGVPTYRDFAAFGARATVWRALIVAQTNQRTGKANLSGFFSAPKNLIIIDSNPPLPTRPFLLSATAIRIRHTLRCDHRN